MRLAHFQWSSVCVCVCVCVFVCVAGAMKKTWIESPHFINRNTQENINRGEMLRRETSGQAVVSFITHSFISFIWSILRATALSMCGSEPWKTIHTPTPKPISTRLFLVHFIHIPRLRLVPMWGTTSRYPTQTAAFIITSCCLATDKGSEFCGGKKKEITEEELGNKLSRMEKMPSLPIHPKVTEHSGKVRTYSSRWETSLHCFKLH